MIKKTAVNIGICLLIGFITKSNADENSWSTNGPEGGRIYTISIHPYDNNTVFIGTIGNGIYNSISRRLS